MNAIMVLAAAVSFLGYFESRNAMANKILEPVGEGEEVKCERPSLDVVEKCPACEGSGELKLEEPNYGQADGRIGGAKKLRVKCPLCRGRGKMESFANPDSLSLQVVRDREAFVSAHQGKGEIPVGFAFVPKDRYAGADKKMLKMVENAYGKPCKCGWTGLEPCRKCSGRGVVKCPNDDCKGGWEVTSQTTSVEMRNSGGGIRNSSGNGGFHAMRSRGRSRKETKTSVHVCPVCGGAALVLCPDCAGRKSAICKKCSGLGYKQPR